MPTKQTGPGITTTTQGTSASDIIVYGQGDKSSDGFPTKEDLIRFIERDVFSKDQSRYRYTQNTNAKIIVLSWDGYAFGHFEIIRKEKPNDEDSKQYKRVKWVYIVGKGLCLCFR
jgi:hypothetical protein